ncbi:CatB-related O-acetyltransferase [Streptomyces sp. NPDC091377]|uniref:CatB-related O-acetyltransferase n=1 Tax=Streptomyces sp. NPDC091377 TaxID=3365995 RepID=UPI0037F43B74
MSPQHEGAEGASRAALIDAWRGAAGHGLDIPDPDEPRPLGDDHCVFIRPVLAPGGKVVAGAYSYYDASEDTAGFEEARVRYAFGPQRLLIGKFCSVAAGATFVMPGANHLHSGPTAFPFATFPGDWQDRLIDPLIERGPQGKGDTVIGNDVWIGRAATIMPGVTVADGAIIGAGAVVASDIGAYQIAAGNPARAVRTRYTPDEIDLLRMAKWWDWPIEAVSRHLPELVLGTPAGVLAAGRAEGLVDGDGPSGEGGRS